MYDNGTFFHVCARGVNRGRIFVDTADVDAYLADLEVIADELDWSVQGYCLMPNHLRLLDPEERDNLGVQRSVRRDE